MQDWREVKDDKEKYALYLNSREWGEKRQAVKRRCGGICERCLKRKLYAVHHLTYIRKYTERLDDLQGICDPCHKYLHGHRDIDPRTEEPSLEEQMMAKVQAMAASFGYWPEPTKEPPTKKYIPGVDEDKPKPKPRVPKYTPGVPQDHVYLFDRKITSVYLAGKISGTKWRDELIASRYDGGWSNWNHGVADKGWSENDGTTGDGHWIPVEGAVKVTASRSLTLTGPFWRPLGQCGGHCRVQCAGGSHLCGNEVGKAHALQWETDRIQVASNVRKALRSSDLVFVWIDSLDCYGTITEIGLAKAMNKLIVVAVHDCFDDTELWLPCTLADAYIRASSALDAWKHLWSDAILNTAPVFLVTDGPGGCLSMGPEDAVSLENEEEPEEPCALNYDDAEVIDVRS